MHISLSKDFISTLINQMWRVLSGPITLISIPLFLNPIEQGYWYTFIGMAALSIFADLGFTTIVLQFSAHEFTALRFGNKMEISGPNEQIWRLASFFRFSVIWGIKMILVVFPLIVIGGGYFLSLKEDLESISWITAWIIYSSASALVFFNGIILSFFEGCNSVHLVQTIRFYIAFITSITILLGLYCNLGLYALSFSLISSSMAGIFFIIKYFRYAITQLWQKTMEKRYNWWPEFSRLIWKYAISWCSGYFTLQLFTPIVFYYFGPISAGKVGISMAMWTAGFNISSSWLISIIPKLNILIEEKKIDVANILFRKNFIRTMQTFIIGGFFYFLLFFSFAEKVFIFQRVLEFRAMLFLFLCWLGQTTINSIAIYLRAYKEEPLMKLSVLMGGYVGISTLLCAMFLDVDMIFSGFISCFIWAIPVSYRIFYKRYFQNKDTNLAN